MNRPLRAEMAVGRRKKTNQTEIFEMVSIVRLWVGLESKSRLVNEAEDMTVKLYMS